tara:strand:- start:574 stop:837 length:264 start_codon:yes stop_codon:yes gene_type:complete
MRRDLMYHHSVLTIKDIDRELIMFQQMCIMFGKLYSISLAIQYLKKLDINVSKTELKYMYLKEKITFLTDFRENRIKQLEYFLKNDS